MLSPSSESLFRCNEFRYVCVGSLLSPPIPRRRPNVEELRAPPECGQFEPVPSVVVMSGSPECVHRALVLRADRKIMFILHAFRLDRVHTLQGIDNTRTGSPRAAI